MLGEEGRLAVVAAERVREDDERERPAVARERDVGAARIGRGRVPDRRRQRAVGRARERAVRHRRAGGVDEHEGGLADAVGAGSLEARAGARVADVGDGGAAAGIRPAGRAGADVVGGILVRVVDDGRAERPIGHVAGVRTAGELEPVAQRAATPGSEASGNARPG
jgi:hypothetical protein